MAINYSVTQRTNPKDAMAEPKWYANAQVKNRYTIDRLADDLVEATTLSRGEVHAVLMDALGYIRRALEAGESVELGELGTFRVAVRSTGADTEEEFDASYIKSARVAFVPGKDLNEMAKGLQYQKVSVRPHI